MMREARDNLRGKQCMTGVDPFAIMRQHEPRLVKSSHFCREMPQ
jgi:hypothetical protein